MSDPDLQTQERPKRLFGRFLLEKVRDNRDKHWLEILDICGYGDCESLFPENGKWFASENEVRESFKYRLFYLNYISAAWRLLCKNFSEKIDDELDYEHGFGMGDRKFKLYPPSYEQRPESFNWVNYAFSRCLQDKDSWFLAPSFWETLHGKNALILMELGGLKWIRQKSGQKKLLFYTNRLKTHLVLHGAELSELDFLGDYVGGEVPKSFHLTCEIKKRFWTDVFRQLFPDLPNALLGKDLVEKYNQLLDQKASRQSILYQCGFVDLKKSKSKGDFAAFNFALRCSMSKEPVLFDQDGNEAKVTESTSSSSDYLEKGNFLEEMPEWVMENDYDVDDQYVEFDGRADVISGSQVSELPTAWPLLTKNSLLKAVLKYHEEKVSETSICIRCGYATDKIGVFRRAFSKVANVEFGPLNKMIGQYYLSNSQAKPSVDDADSVLIEKKEAVRAHMNTVKRSSSLRAQALELHGSRCSVCGIECEEILEVAHIIPVASGGADKPSNTLILCANHHSAFDKFLYAIDPQTREICFKRGVTASSLLVTETVLKANVSARALEARKQMFDRASQ